MKRAWEGRAPAGTRIRGQKNAHGVRIARQPDQPSLPTRRFEQRLVLSLVNEAAVAAVTFGLWWPSKAQLNRRSSTTRPDARIEKRPTARHPPPRPLPVLTDTRSRVCSPSRLPGRRFTAPACRMRAGHAPGVRLNPPPALVSWSRAGACPRPSHPALRFQTIRESPLSPDRTHL